MSKRLNALAPINFIQTPVAFHPCWIRGYCAGDTCSGNRTEKDPVSFSLSCSCSLAPVTKFSRAIAIKSPPLVISGRSSFFHSRETRSEHLRKVNRVSRWETCRNDNGKRQRERRTERRRMRQRAGTSRN